jgi:hypothetical protein
VDTKFCHKLFGLHVAPAQRGRQSGLHCFAENPRAFFFRAFGFRSWMSISAPLAHAPATSESGEGTEQTEFLEWGGRGWNCERQPGLVAGDLEVAAAVPSTAKMRTSPPRRRRRRREPFFSSALSSFRSETGITARSDPAWARRRLAEGLRLD